MRDTDAACVGVGVRTRDVVLERVDDASRVNEGDDESVTDFDFGSDSVRLLLSLSVTDPWPNCDISDDESDVVIDRLVVPDDEMVMDWDVELDCETVVEDDMVVESDMVVEAESDMDIEAEALGDTESETVAEEESESEYD